jgi:hypothetical protein
VNSTATTTANIDPATLTVKAQDESRFYSAPNPALTQSYSGFVAGEDTNVLSGGPALSTSADLSSPVGNYAITITAGSLSASNYSFVFGNATLTIDAASSFTALVSSKNPSILDSNVTFTATLTAVSPATAVPTGNVLFFVNGVALGAPVPLSGGTARVSTALLPQGSNTVTAAYVSDTNFLASTNSLVQVVSTNSILAPSVVGIRNNGDGTVTVTFLGSPGNQYLVQAISNLSSAEQWETVSTNTASGSGQLTFTESTAQRTQRFYRATEP